MTTASIRLPRVLIVGSFPGSDTKVIGGISTSCRVLLGSSLPNRAELALVDTTQRSNPPPSLPVRLCYAMLRVIRYVATIERHRPDAAVLFTSGGASLVEKGLMAWYARLRGIPPLMFPRSGSILDSAAGSAMERAWIRLLFGGARVLLCQGPQWQGFARETLGMQDSRAPVVWNWTATPELLEIGRERIARIGEGEPEPIVRFLFVGWVEREKGILELLDAARALGQRGRFTLEIVGDGRARTEAERRAESLGLSGIVTFTGWMGGDDLLRALDRADVLVLPSRAEGLPNAVIEAMAAGLDVIASAVGNVPHVVREGIEGLLVPPDDVPALTAAMRAAIEDRAASRRRAEAGVARAGEMFAVEPAVDSILAAVQVAREAR